MSRINNDSDSPRVHHGKAVDTSRRRFPAARAVDSAVSPFWIRARARLSRTDSGKRVALCTKAAATENGCSFFSCECISRRMEATCASLYAVVTADRRGLGGFISASRAIVSIGGVKCVLDSAVISSRVSLPPGPPIVFAWSRTPINRWETLKNAAPQAGWAWVSPNCRCRISDNDTSFSNGGKKGTISFTNASFLPLADSIFAWYNRCPRNAFTG